MRSVKSPGNKALVLGCLMLAAMMLVFSRPVAADTIKDAKSKQAVLNKIIAAYSRQKALRSSVAYYFCLDNQGGLMLASRSALKQAGKGNVLGVRLLAIRPPAGDEVLSVTTLHVLKQVAEDFRTWLFVQESPSVAFPYRFEKRVLEKGEVENKGNLIFLTAHFKSGEASVFEFTRVQVYDRVSYKLIWTGNEVPSGERSLTLNRFLTPPQAANLAFKKGSAVIPFNKPADSYPVIRQWLKETSSLSNTTEWLSFLKGK